LFDRESVEFVAGGMKDEQTSEEAARAELQEELNLAAKHIQYIGRLAASAGSSDEQMDIYVAWELEDVVGRPDETETFEVYRMTREEIDEVIYSGDFWDGFCIAAWFLARPFVDGLIDQFGEASLTF